VRRHAASIALATVLAGSAPAQQPVELPVERVAVELRGREQVRAAITAPAWPASVPRTFAGERLVLDAVEVPLAEPATLETAGGRTVVRRCRLTAVPREASYRGHPSAALEARQAGEALTVGGGRPARPARGSCRTVWSPSVSCV
jgi:hypothetical protein